jgi:hypothetical protein
MPTWKVLLICLCAGVCLALGMATFVVPVALEGGQRWMWLGILLAATLGAGGLFALFLTHAGRSIDVPFRGTRR